MTGAAPAADLAAAIDRVASRLALAETALACGAEIPLDDLEACVDAMCGASARTPAAARDDARSALEAILLRLDALEAAIAGKTAP